MDQLTGHVMQFREGETYSNSFHEVNNYRQYTSYHILFSLFILLFHIVIAQHIKNLRQVAGIYESITISRAYVDLKKSKFARVADFQLFFKFIYHYGILIWLYAWEAIMKHFIWESGKPYYTLTYFLLSYGPFNYTEVTALVIIAIHTFFSLFALLICRKNWKYVLFLLLIYEILDILFYCDLLISNLASWFDVTEKLKMYHWFHSMKYYKPFFIFNLTFICFILFNDYIALVQLIKLCVIDIATYTKANLKCIRIRAMIFTLFAILLTIAYRTVSLTWLRVWNNKHNSNSATETFFTYVIYNVSPFNYITSYAIFCCIASILFLINVCLFYFYPNKQTFLINLVCQHFNMLWILVQLSGFVYQYIKIIKDKDSFDKDSLFLLPEHLKPYLKFHIIFLVVLFFCSCVIIAYIYRIWREVCVEEFVVTVVENSSYNNNNGGGISNSSLLSEGTRVVFGDEDKYEKIKDDIVLYTADGRPIEFSKSQLINLGYYEVIGSVISNSSSRSSKKSSKNGVVDYTPISWQPCPGASPISSSNNNNKKAIVNPNSVLLPTTMLLPDTLDQNLIDVDEEEEEEVVHIVVEEGEGEN